MTLLVRTPDGDDLGQIELADGRLVPSGAAAAALAKTALLKTGSAQAAYDLLNGYDNGYVLVGEPAASAVAPPSVSAQLSAPLAVGEQVDLAAIHGHHIPGTAYTFRHGFHLITPGSLPNLNVGSSFNDKYPQWMVDRDKAAKEAVKNAQLDADRADVFVKASVKRTNRQRLADEPGIPISSQRRSFTPDELALLTKHNARQDRADLLAAKIARNPLRNSSVARPAGQGSLQSIAHISRPGYAVAEPSQPKRNPSVEPPPAEPGTVGAKLAAEDPALASLAAPGMSEDAIKKYIDAQVAITVARQVGEIDARREDDLKKACAKMHMSQQKCIALVRETYKTGNEDDDADLRKHTVMNTLFTFGGVAMVIGTLATGMNPLAGAAVAGIIPLVNVIHDYVRNLG